MQNNKAYFLKGMMFLILAQIMVGINIVSSKYLLSSIPILFLLTTRFILATVILLPLHWLTPAKEFSVRYHFAQMNKNDWFFVFAQALTAGIIFNFLMLLGLHYTDANVAGIITSTLPVIIAVMSWIILGEKISAKKSIAVLIASIGLLVIAYDKWQGIGATHSFIGDFIVLLSLFPEAVYYVLCKLHPNRLPVFLTSALLNGINAILMLASLLFVHSNSNISINIEDWFLLFILGLSSGLFYVFWFYGCQRVDGVMASLTTAVMPVSTVILAWALLGEQLTLIQFSGMTLVIFSIVLYAKR